MGLFDNYQFNPQSFQGGGLLDYLETLKQNNPFAPQQPGFDQMPDRYVPVGNYQMPQFGTPDQAALPPNAQPTSGQAPPQMTPPQMTQPEASPFGTTAGIGDRLNAGFQGFANSGGPLQAIGNLIGGLTTGQRSDPQGMQLQQQKATYESLIGSGVPKNLAMAAALNPEVLKTIAPAYFDTAPKLQETGTDPLTGQKSFGVYRPAQGTLSPVSTGGQGSASGGFLAKGIGQVDSSLTGEDYLKQFSPEVQAAVRDYVSGKTMPTGNPRQGFTAAVKQIAQKFGNDIGVPADDTTFAARRQMRNQLSNASPNSLGGQINIGNTAIGHLADLSEKALALDNWDAGISYLSHGVNAVRGMRTEQAAKLNALKGAAQHYGQEITKFYAGSPGGEGERNRFLEAVDGAKSPKELAAVIETEAELMRSRLGALGDQIKGVLGPLSSEYPVVRPDSEKAFGKVNENVSRLRGGVASSGHPAPDPLGIR